MFAPHVAARIRKVSAPFFHLRERRSMTPSGVPALSPWPGSNVGTLTRSDTDADVRQTPRGYIQALSDDPRAVLARVCVRLLR
jgi:hypothetical protein